MATASLARFAIYSVVALVTSASVAYGVDQNQKRKKEQAAYRDRLKAIESAVASKQERYAILKAQLGRRNKQVRILAGEVLLLRQKAAELKRRQGK